MPLESALAIPVGDAVTDERSGGGGHRAGGGGGLEGLPCRRRAAAAPSASNAERRERLAHDADGLGHLVDPDLAHVAESEDPADPLALAAGDDEARARAWRR